jgi:hypothetical protein
MTIDGIKKAVCTWLNSNGFGPAMVTPTSAPAPEGKYIAVRDLGVEQFGRHIKARPGNVENENNASFMQVADIVMTEVEGEGDTLREIRNRMQLPAFRTWAEGQGFTIWDIGSIMNNDTADGEFWIRQKSFTFQAQFVDEVASSAVRALAAGVEINGEPVEVEININ